MNFPSKNFPGKVGVYVVRSQLITSSSGFKEKNGWKLYIIVTALVERFPSFM